MKKFQKSSFVCNFYNILLRKHRIKLSMKIYDFILQKVLVSIFVQMN